MSSNRYTAADLAHLAGVSLRTVRFYVQEGLIDAPEGRGRGSHFRERHLHQLRRVRALQAAGLDNAAIRSHAEELDRILGERGLTLESAGRVWRSMAISNLLDTPADGFAEPQPMEEEDEAELDLANSVRIPMAQGVELLVAKDIPLPSPRRLVDLAMTIRRFFRSPKE
jgi:DNA-binding transcriptional MerR regulator